MLAGDDGVDDVPRENGVATAVRAVTTLRTTNWVIRRRCGRAKAAMRRRVAGAKGRVSCWAFMTLCSCVHAVVSMLMK